ncbi:carboxymuconolactone decarboxylase family protein, partial [Streptomyces hayashii]|uniref:carboxymuconolactone decarboxylase family protein n=1 Tax=Streptomyces hayashii TaxID=2839966 RepID=UPI00403C10D8
GAARAEVLGDDGTRLPPGDPVPAEFQDYLVSVAWGAWARGGPLGRRNRSLLVLAMKAALGRMDEFRLHLRAAPRAGVTDAEVDELLFQIAAYCGAPAGNSARSAVREVRGDREGK